MIVAFDAHACTVTTLADVETFLIMLADDAETPSQYVEIQQALGGYDQQDIDLGMDTYCVVTSSGASCYGCISACVVSNNTLSLILTKEGEGELGFKGYEIALSLSEADIAQLRSGLARVFQNDKYAPQHLIL